MVENEPLNHGGDNYFGGRRYQNPATIRSERPGTWQLNQRRIIHVLDIIWSRMLILDVDEPSSYSSPE